MIWVRFVPLALIALVGACASVGVAPASPAPATVPNPTATVGPLFANGTKAPHGCTASVLDSPAGNLILTAAHCVSGTGAGLEFAPGYDTGAMPHGVWSVTAAYADPAWISGQDPRYDYAILRVASQAQAADIESVTGGSALGSMPASGQQVTVVAYNAGRNDQAKRCDATVRYERGYPTFDCAGFVGGSSGAPWLAWSAVAHRYVVHAVIGGLEHGGCVDSTSYSSPFGADIAQLLARAEANGVPDTLPQPHSDGCPSG